MTSPSPSPSPAPGPRKPLITGRHRRRDGATVDLALYADDPEYRARVDERAARETPAPTPVGAPGWLAEVRTELALATGPDTVMSTDAADARFRLAFDRVPPLVAALEAVLALTGEWEQRAATLAGETPIAAEYQTCRAQTLSECANRAKVAIETALRDTQGGAV